MDDRAGEAARCLERLRQRLQVDEALVDPARALAAVQRLVADCPALEREPGYLGVLSRTGGLHAHSAAVSFGLFGFGVQVTSILEGPLLEDGRWLRFADLIQPQMTENLVFAFDLAGRDRTVFATPGDRSDWAPHAAGFEALIERVVALA